MSFGEGVAGGAASLVAIVPAAWHIGRRVWRHFVNDVADRLATLQRTTDDVKTQVTPNGGASDELATQVVALRTEVKALRTVLVRFLRDAGYQP